MTDKQTLWVNCQCDECLDAMIRVDEARVLNRKPVCRECYLQVIKDVGDPEWADLPVVTLAYLDDMERYTDAVALLRDYAAMLRAALRVPAGTCVPPGKARAVNVFYTDEEALADWAFKNEERLHDILRRTAEMESGDV